MLYGVSLSLSVQTHKKKVREKKQQLTKLKVQAERRRGDNRQLDQTLMDKQVSVLERQGAEKLAGKPACNTFLSLSFNPTSTYGAMVSAFGC